MRTQFVLSEMAIGLRRNVTMTLAAIVTITISLTLLGGALAIRNGTNKIEHNLLGQLNVQVFLDYECGTPLAKDSPCLTQTEQANIERTLQTLPAVKKVTYVDAAETYARFKALFADQPELIKEASKNALGTSFDVELNDPHQFEAVATAVEDAPGVAQVSNANSILKATFTFLHHLTIGVLLVALLAIVASCLLIYNTMLVAAFSRRRETGIMRLVGASDFYIQAPFILEGTVVGVFGAALAIGLLCGARTVVNRSAASSQLAPLGMWSSYVHAMPWVLIVGVVLSAAASFLTLQRHMRV